MIFKKIFCDESSILYLKYLYKLFINRINKGVFDLNKFSDQRLDFGLESQELKKAISSSTSIVSFFTPTNFLIPKLSFKGVRFYTIIL